MESQNHFTNLIELQKQFSDENVCWEHLEQLRWNGRVICPFCFSDKHYKFQNSHTYKCAFKECGRKFNAKIGTIFENSKIPLSKWFIAIYLGANHKKGISSLQLSRDLGFTQKSAWFVLHRVREMLKDKAPAMLKGTIEVDETYVGGKEKNKHQSKFEKDKRRNEKGKIARTSGSDKAVVFGLIQRNGKMLNYIVPNTEADTILPIILKQIEKGSHMVTDDLRVYRNVVALGYQHTYVNHQSGEYVKGEAHTANIDNFWSLLKRGIIGIYHYTSKKHLHRYCNEFAFRYNTRNQEESIRFDTALTQCEARLRYKDLIKKST